MTGDSKMIARAIEGFKNDGKLDVAELDQILDIAMSDGALDEHEKKALINILFSLTSSDLTPELWSRVEQLVQRFGLDK
ncbi:MAG: tellurite resistance protein [Lysobacterales bacterium]|jgi:tellurite resistance protein